MLAETVDPVNILLVNGGIIGVFFVLALMGYIELKPAIARRDALEKQQQALVDTLLAVYHHEVLPTLGDIERRVIPLLVEVEKMLEYLRWLIEEEGDAPPPSSRARRRNPQGSDRSSKRQSPGSSYRSSVEGDN